MMAAQVGKKGIRKVLIANRGEIAVRVALTCKRLGIATVAVFSNANRNAVHVKVCDEAFRLGAADPASSYLNVEKLIEGAKSLGCDALHPGYGFLSENPILAEACAANQIIFVGPSSDAIRIMGSKIEAKRLLSKKAPSIPLIPGYNGDDNSIAALKKEALQIGFPVLLKASAGGGGKGMRIVREEKDLEAGIELAKSEAKNSFGDDKLLIERYFDSVRHIEIQIFGDHSGNVSHVFERECTIQRRHQKVIEEAPSPIMTPSLRAKMTRAAEEIGKAIKYVGAGTVEFIVTEKHEFFFLEVNTRLQVEHPVTEEITNLDLVACQLYIAEGRTLSQVGIQGATIRGHAIECRLYAENPNKNFFPCTGQLHVWKPYYPPKSSSCRFRYDSGVEQGSEITIHYDPMIAKCIVWAPTRSLAISGMLEVIRKTVVLGLQTNQLFLSQLLSHPNFAPAAFDTHFIEKYFPPQQIRKLVDIQRKSHGEELGIVSTLWGWAVREQQRKTWRHLPSGWRNLRYRPQLQYWRFHEDTMAGSESDSSESIDHCVQYIAQEPPFESGRRGKAARPFWIQCGEEKEKTILLEDVQIDHVGSIIPSSSTVVEYGWLRCRIGSVMRTYTIAAEGDGNSASGRSWDALHGTLFIHCHQFEGPILVERCSRFRSCVEEEDDDSGAYVAPMPAKILKVVVQEGAQVKKGDHLITIESMKMESRINATSAGIVKIFVSEGEMVSAGTVMCAVEAKES